ncbi:MAG: hypothetical protein DRP11_00560 [Candidatus Aenigmatarchaeota archaeon]|nr:MAG: hypothetical protein DRP11_00560 [Candidatus Aenigmarchaeota archaeon]
MYSWGVKALDELTGGIRPILMMFYGETGSGKTTLAAYVPTTRIAIERKKLESNEKFIVIDGDGGFDMWRAEQIWKNNGLEPDVMAEHLEYVEVESFDDQHQTVKKLPETIEKRQIKPLLIVCDPMTAFYRGIILRTDMRHRATVIGQYTGKLDLQLTTLRYLTVKYKVPVIITTWPSSPVGKAFGAESEVPFIGGRAFGFFPKLIVELSVVERGRPVRRAYLWKAKGLPAGKTVEFKLSDKGVEDV